MKRKKFHIKIIYLKLFGEENKSKKNTPFTSFFGFLSANFKEKNWHPKNVNHFLLKNYETFFLQLKYL